MESQFSRNAIDLEIETLFGQARDSDPFNEVIRPRFQEFSENFENGASGLTEKETESYLYDDSFPVRKFEDVLVGTTAVVKGADINDLPTEYTLHDLRRHEQPVIGTFIHENILPGFKYIVRLLGSEKCQFSGRPMTLQRIGQGYGKRITFASETKNINNNYFYSDTRQQGYGFSIVAVQPGDSFTVLDADHRPVGTGTIEETEIAQRELATQVRKNGDVIKQVAVTFSCNVRYGARKGAFPLCNEHTLELSGIAIVVKKKRASSATTQEIEQLELPLLGPCSFHVEL